MIRTKSKKVFSTLMLCLLVPFFLYISSQPNDSSEIQQSQSKDTNNEPNIIYLNENYDYTDQLNMTDFSCNIFTSQKPFYAIDGETYPKVTPMYHNSSINLTCLNKNKVVGSKRILIWNSTPFKNYLEKVVVSNLKKGLTSKHIFNELKCPVNNCEVTINRSMLSQSSMVIFHIRNSIDKFPSYRKKDQRWVNITFKIHTAMIF
jgi:hypothetical protein